MFEKLGIGESNGLEVLFFFLFPDPVESLKTINVILYSSYTGTVLNTTALLNISDE
jgi:hypothetical protein